MSDDFKMDMDYEGRQHGREHAMRLVRGTLEAYGDDDLVGVAHDLAMPEDADFDRGFVAGFKDARAYALSVLAEPLPDEAIGRG